MSVFWYESTYCLAVAGYKNPQQINHWLPAVQ
jgi:hypothetical protein